jgi:hypothetical protein
LPGNVVVSILSRTVIGFIACLLVSHAPLAQSSGKYPYDNKALLPFNFREVCKSPTQSPNCLAKLAINCTRGGASGAECALIGFPMNDREPAPRYPLGPKAWTKEWSDVRNLADTDFCSMSPMLLRTVGPDRFTAQPPLPPELIGTHEMIIFAGRCRPLEIAAGYSIFMKQTAKGWQATSYKVSLLLNGREGPLTPEQQKYNYRADPGYEEECETYGCGAIYKSEFGKPLTAAECVGRLCAYVARGIRAPDVPIKKDYVPFHAAPVFMPGGIELQCAYLDPKQNKLCDHQYGPS